MSSPINMVYYAAVAKGSVIVAEYIAEGNTEMPTIATTCLKYVPPLHSRFSHTARKRRFICIVDGILTYFSIMDEALSKEDAFSFLQKIRDAFDSLHRGKCPDLEVHTLGAQLLDEEMAPIMERHALLLTEVPRRETLCRETEPKAMKDAESCTEFICPSSRASLDEEFQGYGCWQVGSWLRSLCECK
ncbi:hypothetical protein KP509_13G000800 [Ceratopteris richardii]|uniref:Longin domain-containing protein n=1 Tax=Ceratopteris richardii TaxID=49495 RepID=A0A8T2TCX3_CERRI|nr:hypothetical protein KP509_13G000800 [Ceratopteris richardii]